MSERNADNDLLAARDAKQWADQHVWDIPTNVFSMIANAAGWVERARKAEAKCKELEAQAGAMRAALNKACGLLGFLVAAGHYAGDKELLQECENALSSDTGRSVQERMAKLEKVAERVKALEAVLAIAREMLDCDTLLSFVVRQQRLRDALRELEGK